MWNKHFAGRVDGELNTYDAFDDDIFNALHELNSVNVVGLEVLEEGAERPLVPL